MKNQQNRNTDSVSPTDDYARMLQLSNLLREPALRGAVDTLQLPRGSRGLDAGCGIGLNTLLLAHAVAPGGHVTGVDISPQFLDEAKEAAADSDLTGQISFEEGDVNKLPFAGNTFDWVWSADTVWPGPREMGCPAEEPLPIIRELARVVKPGGIVAIVFWSSQRLLPGYPHLEARLNATSQATAPCSEGMRPELHCQRALGWLHDANLEQPTAHTFAAEIHAPLGDDVREAVAAVFQMFWGKAKREVTQEDWAEFERLCLPESPDFIVSLPDYYAFLTYSLFRARVHE